MKGSYADQINAARLLLGGLKSQGPTFPIGWPGAEAPGHRRAVARLPMVANRPQDGWHAEQEALKSRLAEKTTELTSKLEGLTKAAAEVKKLAKLDLPKESWKEFGITDAR